jgi:pyrroloquinoline quinone biosynthesis protein B
VAIGDDDGERWFLIGASPDIRPQLEMLPRRTPGGSVRCSVIEGVLLPSGDLDQVLGLFSLREGDPPRVFATPAVRLALCEGLNLGGVLGAYGGVEWLPLATERPSTLPWSDGRSSGITCLAFGLSGKPPKYRERVALPDPLDAVGFRLVDEQTGGRLIVAQGLANLDDLLIDRLGDCDLLLIDGTFWSERELAETVRLGTSAPASAMGHLPVGGVGGSLDQLAELPVARKIYLHINNTNPMILDDSSERREVEAAGFEVGCDGQEFSL